MNRKHRQRALRAAQAEAARMDLGGVANVGPGFGINPAYRAAGYDSQETAAWYVSTASADAEVLGAKDLSLARIRDVLRNDPSARAGLDRLVDSIVGAGLHLSEKPDGVALGITNRKELRTLARQMQAEWRLFADDPRKTCDAQRKLTMNGLFRLFCRTMLTAGEMTAVMSWRDPSKGMAQRYSTCVLAIDPDRLCNPDGQPVTSTLRGGIEMDGLGEPIAYHVRNAHVGDYWASDQSSTWTRVARVTSWGRPIFIHGFEPEREGQTRGISPFVSLISRLRMIGKHADHELAAAAANALNVAFVETQLPPEEVAQRLSPREPTYAGYSNSVVKHFTENPAKVGGVRIPVFPPGSTMKMNSTPRQTSSFSSFQTAFLRSIAAAMGLSYEQLSMDWSQTNYSSARAALNEVWRTIKRLSAVFVEQVVTPIYYAVMEEAFAKGYIRLPASARPLGMQGLDLEAANDNLAVFHAMPGAILRARWIGPGRGFIDPVKEAEAAALRMQSLTSTLENECADQGYDYEDILDQIAIENEELADRKIVRQVISATPQDAAEPEEPPPASKPAVPSAEPKAKRSLRAAFAKFLRAA